MTRTPACCLFVVVVVVVEYRRPMVVPFLDNFTRDTHGVPDLFWGQMEKHGFCASGKMQIYVGARFSPFVVATISV